MASGIKPMCVIDNSPGAWLVLVLDSLMVGVEGDTDVDFPVFNSTIRIYSLTAALDCATATQSYAELRRLANE